MNDPNSRFTGYMLDVKECEESQFCFLLDYILSLENKAALSVPIYRSSFK
jgi:hypothetical protein